MPVRMGILALWFQSLSQFLLMDPTWSKPSISSFDVTITKFFSENFSTLSNTSSWNELLTRKGPEPDMREQRLLCTETCLSVIKKLGKLLLMSSSLYSNHIRNIKMAGLHFLILPLKPATHIVLEYSASYHQPMKYSSIIHLAAMLRLTPMYPAVCETNQARVLHIKLLALPRPLRCLPERLNMNS